jgi:hypothetical protein
MRNNGGAPSATLGDDDDDADADGNFSGGSAKSSGGDTRKAGKAGKAGKTGKAGKMGKSGKGQPGKAKAKSPAGLATLMIDLRRRIAASPTEHVRSPAMDYTLVRMMTWWQQHTVTSAWRSLKAHVRVRETSTDLADALAEFLWNVRGILGTATDGDQP